jgi:hypothetical protein
MVSKRMVSPSRVVPFVSYFCMGVLMARDVVFKQEASITVSNTQTPLN